LTRRSRVAVLFCFAFLILGAAGCSGHSTTPGHPPAASQSVTVHPVNGRFTVTIDGKALQEATAAGVNLPALIARALAHINALLPGPGSPITVGYARPSALIEQAGVAGFTHPLTAHITTSFGATPQVSTGEALRFWFPRDLAHEVNHAVRILNGPGFGPALLQQLISEGIATAFDQAAFPGPADPWTHAITQTQECALWEKAEPQLGYTSFYDAWMLGGYGIPHWTGFTIGYHIVNQYRSHHSGVSWAALTSASAEAILAGSHYQPCPR